MTLQMPDPDAYNRDTIAGLISTHRSTLDQIFQQYPDRDTGLFARYRSRMERHLLPALEISRMQPGLAIQDIITYGNLFLMGYSMPVMLLNEWLDGKNAVQPCAMSHAISQIYAAQCVYPCLPNGLQVSAEINAIYQTVTRSLEEEVKHRLQLPSSGEIKIFQPFEWDSNRFYRSVCGYFSAVTSGFFALQGIPFHPRLRRFLFLFGVLRQLADELGDVAEDLQSGTITTPVFYALQQNDFRADIQALWNGYDTVTRVTSQVAQHGGYERAYQTALHVYALCRDLKDDLSDTYPFLPSLFVFYDLKVCLLARLKRDGWTDAMRLY